MYFITYGGLSVYDGVAFKNYNQHHGLANELVNDVLEITPDSMLIATNAPMLNTLVRNKIGIHKTSDNFYPVTNRFLNSQDGFLYSAADEGLFRLVDNVFVKIPLLDNTGKDIGFNLDRITEWKDYLLIIPWNSPQHVELIIYDRIKKTVLGIISDKTITTTVVTPTGELWMNSSDGIEMLDLSSLQRGIIRLLPASITGISSHWNGAFIYFDAYDEMWLFQNEEILHRVSSGQDQIFSGIQGLKTNKLSDLFVDREGITWMSSDGNGVVKMTDSNVWISAELKRGTKNKIGAFYQQSDTTWVFNSTDNSFYRIHDHQLTAFPIGREFKGVISIYIQGKSLYFVAQPIIYKIENKDLPSSYSHPIEITPEIYPVLEIGVSHIDPNLTLIQAVRQDDTTFYLCISKNDKLLLKHKLSFSTDQVAIDRDGQLWVVTRDNQLKVYSLHPETPSQYLRLKYDYSNAIKDVGPRSIAVDTNGNAWIGTRYNGIYLLQFEKEKFQSSLQWTTRQGLTDNFYNYLYCDHTNTIWAGSQTGLDKISFTNGAYRIENISKSRSIFQGIYNIINAADDVIWALTTIGEIIIISIDSTAKSVSPPSLFITSFSINSLVYDEVPVMFDYNENNFSISVATPSFLDEKAIQYRYWLQGGGNDHWSTPGNNAHFDFINLAPGIYTLHVKAEFPADLYPVQQFDYGFTIRPPFWQTWWFVSCMIIGLGVVLGLIYRFYYNVKLEKQRNMLERKQALEKERTRIATDMHDDLGSGLSRIKFLSETIGIKKQQQLPIEDEISHIRTYAHEMIDKMGEIVWALNEKNDSLSDLLSYTRAYAVEYLAENGLQSKIDKLPQFKEIMVNSEFRRNIFLSVKESLHNVIKHAKAKEVSIHFETNTMLVISIQDDGVGFDPENTHSFGNGLTNIRKRMEEIEGDLQIIHAHGTRVILSVPLPT